LISRTQAENNQLPPPEFALAGFRVANEQSERSQQEQGAHQLVIGGTPGHGADERCVSGPEDACDQARKAGFAGLAGGSTAGSAGNPCDQQQVGNCRSESDNAKWQLVQPEQGLHPHKKSALAPGADGALGHRGKQFKEEIVRGANLTEQAEPGEIVGDEPSGERVPIQPEQEGHRQKPPQGVHCRS